MAFWIQKKIKEKQENGKTNASATGDGRKSIEKNGTPPKRIDNLRIPQQLRIVLKSIGTLNSWDFLTKDLSSTGAFVICENVKRYPFQPQSTLIDASVELKNPDSAEVHKLQFIGKIARVVDAKEGLSGFGLRIIQISNEQRMILENFIVNHGAPDFQNGQEEVPEQKEELNTKEDETLWNDRSEEEMVPRAG